MPMYYVLFQKLQEKNVKNLKEKNLEKAIFYSFTFDFVI